MNQTKKQIHDYIEQQVRHSRPSSVLGRLRLASMRITYGVLRDLLEGQLTLRAMSLVYTTLLSLVPLLAVSFSVLKAFGVHNQVKPLLFEFLSRMGPQGLEVGEKIMGFVDNIKVGVLGSVGIALLFYTVISLLQKIERSFNYIWRVEEARHLSRRFSDYLSVILVGPVLMFTAIGISASVKSSAIVQSLSTISILGEGIGLIGRTLPYLLIIIAFCFVYIFMPNTKVRLKSALTGAIIAGLFWETTSWLFASFAMSSANYAAIYSSFAILVLFMIWLYLGWIILLVGADVAFYHQHPRVLSSANECNCLEQKQREQLAIQIMYLIALHFHKGKPAWTLNALAAELNRPSEQVSRLLHSFAEAGLLGKTTGNGKIWLPARETDSIKLIDILHAARGEKTAITTCGHEGARVASMFVTERTEHAMVSSLEDNSLKDLILRFPESDDATQPA
ncbi:YhjD/YihY/BrkB family envelope integrity protein [Sulfuriflexus mobilis]|uniref:YhjD/YihY/BrkB family envelope integrity protein n=1 Tax=Sulfuriflexus mobilis TaxID=1811807 RepID=UPI000F83B20D|nr:YhjD/YihY/BrkB family envelope integrity protein [Sulfuriflexus mobilis]